MTKPHTPGPWTAIGTDVKTPGNNSRVICWTGQPEISLDQARANARLIAAAPELLAALKDLEALASRWLRDANSPTNIPTLVDARAAITKATKEP